MEITRFIKSKKSNINNINSKNINISKINFKLGVFNYIQESKYKPEEVLGDFTDLECHYIWSQTHKYKRL